MSEDSQPAFGPVDFEALALHVIAFTGELEQAWSAALDSASMERASEELGIELGALATAMTAAMQQADASLTEAGIDPKIYSWPYEPDLFKSIEPTFDPEARRSQLVISQLLALRELLAAFNALREPSGERVNLTAGREGKLTPKSRTAWFEAGAFSLFRFRAGLLLRITLEIERSTGALLEETSVPKLDLSIGVAFDSLEGARSAYSRGDIDAALVHARGALRGILESMPFISHGDERLLRPGTLLARAPSLREYASALRLLDAETEALASRRADLGVAVALVDGLIPVIGSIVHEPPIAELQKVVAAEGKRT